MIRPESLELLVKFKAHARFLCLCSAGLPLVGFWAGNSTENPCFARCVHVDFSRLGVTPTGDIPRFKALLALGSASHKGFGTDGAAGGDRTHDPWLRRPILYPLSYSRVGGTVKRLKDTGFPVARPCVRSTGLCISINAMHLSLCKEWIFNALTATFGAVETSIQTGHEVPSVQ